MVKYYKILINLFSYTEKQFTALLSWSQLFPYTRGIKFSRKRQMNRISKRHNVQVDVV